MKNYKNSHHRSLFSQNQKQFHGIYVSPSRSNSRSPLKSTTKHNDSVRNPTHNNSVKTPSHNNSVHTPSHNNSLIMVKQIPKIKQFTSHTKLKLSRDQMQKIKRSLQIQHQANLNFLRRLDNKNLYYAQKRKQNDKSNKKSNNIIHKYNAQLQRKKLNNHTNIQVSLDLFENKDPITIKSIKQRCPPMNLTNLTKHSHKILKINKQQNIKQKNKNISISSISPDKINIQESINLEQDPFQSLQKIIKMPQERYSQKMWNKKQINIFKLIKNQKYFLNSKESIDQYYFCYDSIVSLNNQKRNGNIFRDLSSFSRKFIKNNYKVDFQFKLNETDLNFDEKYYNFAQMMLISTGYLQPNVLNNYLNNYGYGNVKNNEMDSHISMDFINYNDNTNNVANNYNIDAYDQTQKKRYIQVNLTKEQQQEYKKAILYNNKIKKLLQDQQVSLKNGIKDKNIIDKYQNYVESLIHQRFVVNKRRDQNQLNRLVAMNKLYKTKIQNINMKVLKDIIVYKKEKDLVKENLKKNKSKSPKKQIIWK